MGIRAPALGTDIKRRRVIVVIAQCLALIGTVLCSSVPASAAPTLPTPAEQGREIARGPTPSSPAEQAREIARAPTLRSSAEPGREIARAAVAPRVVPTCDSQFHQVAGANPGTAGNIILNNALAAISATDIWAVGAQADFTTGTTVGKDRALAEHWDGSSWTATSTPMPYPGNNDLWGVATVPGATTAANNVWAVGDTTEGTGLERALVLQWNGTAWNQSAPPGPAVGLGNNILFGVAPITSTNIWAVGNYQADTNQATQRRTLIEHYDGAAWSIVASPDLTTTSSDRLLAVSGNGASDIWAVGRSIDANVENPLILHYDGMNWSITQSQSYGSGGILYGVKALSSTLAYAVGNWWDANGFAHTLLEQWNGTAWSIISFGDLGPPNRDNALFSVNGLSANDVWLAGGSFAHNQTGTPSDTLVVHWDGRNWTVVPSQDGVAGGSNEANAILPITSTNVWMAGDYASSAQSQGLTLFENLCMSVPTVTGVSPISGYYTGWTTVEITGTDLRFANAVKFGGTDPYGWFVNSNTSINATVPAGTIGTVDVSVTNPAGTSATSPADTYIYVQRAMSWQQYRFTGSDGAFWAPIDSTNLVVAFQPTADSMAIISGNADLWTSMAGVNQDLGLMVTGGAYSTPTLVAWKESGGYAGTFSPNAAFVQAVIPVTALGLYDVKLVWKSNKPTAGAIFTAAGAGPNYSPTRLTVEMVPTTSTNLKSVATNSQYSMAGSDGSNWQDIDTANLTIANYAPSASGSALVSANADLWTAMAGVNQDIGIFISGGTFGTLGSIGTLVGWKESGGYGGTFSPNAAYAQSMIQLSGGVPYTIKLQWKANKNTAGTIYAAAGTAGAYSPTRLTLRMFPAGTGLQDAMTNSQYSKAGSTGSDWLPIDATNLTLTVNPAANSVWVLSGNADLWTATVGVNQDLGIFVSGGAYGSGTLVAWKESGGYGGTFSPNAAFVQTVIPLAMGVSYTIILEWKANTATGGTIYAAAGSGPAPNYSPTRITAQLVG